jgi:hypothetical protein
MANELDIPKYTWIIVVYIIIYLVHKIGHHELQWLS